MIKSQTTKNIKSPAQTFFFPAQTKDPIPSMKEKHSQENKISSVATKNDILGTIGMKFMIVDFIYALLEILNLLLMNILLTIPQIVR